jgi:hypothetical protein
MPETPRERSIRENREREKLALQKYERRRRRRARQRPQVRATILALARAALDVGERQPADLITTEEYGFAVLTALPDAAAAPGDKDYVLMAWFCPVRVEKTVRAGVAWCAYAAKVRGTAKNFEFFMANEDLSPLHGGNGQEYLTLTLPDDLAERAYDLWVRHN